MGASEVEYRKVASSNMIHLEAFVGIYRLLMKGICDAYDKKFIFELVMRINTRDYTVK